MRCPDLTHYKVDFFLKFGHKIKRVTACGGLILTGCQVPTEAALSLHFLSWTGERKYDVKLVGQDKDTEKSLTNYHHEQNRLELGK